MLSRDCTGPVRSAVRACSLLALVGSVACSDGTDDGLSGARTIDSAGVEIVMNSGAVVQGQLTESLRIGVAEGDESYEFHRIGSITTDPSGHLYVADQGSSTIRVYTPDGEFMRAIGRKGGGPGEFDPLVDVWMGRDDIIAMGAGGGPPRLSRFRLSGEFLDTRPYMEDRTTIVPLGHGDGTWLVRLRHLADPRTLTPGALFVDSVAVAPFYPAADSVGQPIRQFADVARIITPGGEGMAGPLFDPIPQLGLDTAGRIYRTGGMEYTVDVFDPRGRLVRRVRREYESRPIQAEWIDGYANTVRGFYNTMPDYPSKDAELARTIDERSKRIRVDHLPPTGRLLLARDGAFWVERSDLEEEPWRREYRRMFDRNAPRPPSVWEVFNGDGGYVATVELSSAFRPEEVTVNSVVGVLRDELDVEYVVHYDLHVGTGGAEQ